MEQVRYDEMVENFQSYKESLVGKTIFLFGHCEATLALEDLLVDNNLTPIAILDNNKNKHGIVYKGISVVSPIKVLEVPAENAVVLIVTRFYEAMNSQLRKLGFAGSVIKLVDYNTYAEYSLSEDVQKRKLERVEHGSKILSVLKKKYSNILLILCPFNALGDIYFCMSYLDAFLAKKGVTEYAIIVPSKSCASVARLFGATKVEVFEQKGLDALIQAAIYYKDENCFIAHQDRPYVVNLHNVLKSKRISLEKIYCCGIFGLLENTKPVEPTEWKMWDKLDDIDERNAVILSPYAKSVATLPIELWNEIASDYSERGYQVFTNVCGNEKAIEGTIEIRTELSEMKSVLEKAGTFIGIRSGLCDVIRTANCRKIAIYPDYNYCDTKWKAIDMYSIKGFENIVYKDGYSWKKLIERMKV